MSRRTMVVAIVGLMLAVAAAALHYQTLYPRQIIGTSSITVERTGAAGQRQMLAVRKVRIADTVFEEVELPGGTWIGCEGDCRAAARVALDAFWADQEQRRK